MIYDAAVTILSVLISIQFGLAALDNRKHRKAVFALGMKSAMFSLYALAGFLPTVAPLHPDIVVVLKGALLIIAGAFFVTNQSRVIFSGLRND